MGIDIGTSVAKGVVINDVGDLIAKASFVRQHIKQSEGKYEHDADQVWWKEFVYITQSMLKQLGSLKQSLQCLAITAMVPNILPIDTQGRPLHEAILYYDGRAHLIEEQLDAQSGTSKWQNQVLAMLIRLKTELGPNWGNVNKILTTHNYIIMKLTGKICVDSITSLECGNILDSNKMEWDQDLLDRYGIRSSVFPDIVAPGTIVGFVSKEAAEITGLNVGLSVVAGTTDTMGTFIGAGAWNPKDLLICYGTYGCAPMLLKDLKEVLFEKRLTYPMEWVASIPRSGQQLSSLAQVFLPSSTPEEALSKLDGLAEVSIPGANGVVFVQMLGLARSIECSEPRGTFFNLGKDNTMADICRAMLEAFGYGLKYCFEASATVVEPKKCYAAAGGARSRIWRQIVSDITGLEQFYFPYADSAFGSAILAAVSIVPEIWEQIDKHRISCYETISPSFQNDKEYDAAYQVYKNCIATFNGI